VSCLLSNVTKLQGELDILMLLSNCNEVSKKKAALDEAFAKCLDFCKQYFRRVITNRKGSWSEVHELATYEIYVIKIINNLYKYAVIKKVLLVTCVAQRRDELLFPQSPGRRKWSRFSWNIRNASGARTSPSINREEAEFRRQKLEIELERARRAQMELLNFKEAMSSGSSRLKRKEQMQRREGLLKNSPDEPVDARRSARTWYLFP